MLSKNLLYKRIRQFATETPDWATAIRYHTKPDEKHKLVCDRKIKNDNRTTIKTDSPKL